MVYEMIAIGYGNYIAKARVIAVVGRFGTGAPFDTGCARQRRRSSMRQGSQDESRHRDGQRSHHFVCDET